METFTHLDKIIDEQEGSDSNMKARVGNAKAVFRQRTSETQNNRQPTPKSQFLTQTSR
ncbi:unnamed protein product [Schistosoma mattheei]|uniref:Uncharacterized protein n=1 Tax=Schistosoma mattheei TaxID=31246 RepID=A0A183NPE9_9TREM|nr:unnamed protein product [Schistosoma mattheei]